MWENIFLIEVSSETARKIGGIYTVLMSKSHRIVEIFKQNYLLVGLYDQYVGKGEFFEEQPPDETLAKIFSELKGLGIKCYYGKWIVGGDARVILIEPSEFGEKTVNGEKQINLIKYELWKDFGIDSLFMGWDFNRNVLWAYAAGILIEKIINSYPSFKFIVHCHEWISGAALLYLRKKKVRASLIFTTHATSLGRAKVAAGEDLIKEVNEGIKSGKTVDVQIAYRFKLEGQHLLEKACVNHCDVFTTVSDVIDREAEYMFGRKSDVITPNGIDFNRVPNVGEVKHIARSAREEVEKLCYAIFLPYYAIHPKDSLFIYLSGRYEMYDKGIDLYIKCLAKLDELLRKKQIIKDIFAFIFVPTSITRPNEDICTNLLIVDRMYDLFKSYRIDPEILSDFNEVTKFLAEFSDGKKVDISKFSQFFLDLPQDVKMEAVKLYKNLRKSNSNPPINCFLLTYPNDQILNLLTSLGLVNSQFNRVKVIFYPTYLRPGDGLLHMEYWKVISAFDLGIFPSRYEPWGYTPVEAATMLNLAMTTDKAGFGRYILEKFGEKLSIAVIPMVDRSEEEVIEWMTQHVLKILNLSREELELLKEEARKIVESCDWSTQINSYLKAYELGLRKVEGK
ncbi:MAG: glycogen/starch synthase [Candidatus Parvarchaeota archaeon]|nr:glycogen/starch synthase [Candidatus Haiyanarchaeum thermophilum]MCW1306631.1 glycogen/starch synthase [Candidatus Haiyanarchaeum thermophilum]MCW1307043.1 glycogen/starch synthase [Candidatus Haiyanarchaeum thermophilum]MCW1307714.1 glycogen/starch synthase [Candidatus Haiyanarchaeum thermophilum]